MPWPKWPRPRAGPDHGPLMYMVSEPKFNLGSQNLLSFIKPTLPVIKSWTPPNATSRSQGTPPADSHCPCKPKRSTHQNPTAPDTILCTVWANWTIIYQTTGMCHVNIWKKFVFLFFLLCCSIKKRYHTPSYGNDFCSKGEAATKQRLDGKKLKTFSTFIWCVKSSFFRSGKVGFKCFKL